MQNLDLWLKYVDTTEIIPLFDQTLREYTVPRLVDVDWSDEPEFVIKIAKEENLETLESLDSEKQYTEVFCRLLGRDAKALLLRCFKYLLQRLCSRHTACIETPVIIRVMIEFLYRAPFLSITFASDEFWGYIISEESESVKYSVQMVLSAIVLSTTNAESFIVEPFKKVLSYVESISFTHAKDLIELISLTVRSTDIALDLLLECLEPASRRILHQHTPHLADHFIRSLMGIALDHIDEASQPQPLRQGLFDLEIVSSNLRGYPVVKTNLRIDAPVGALAATDHVRLTTASPPTNSTAMRNYSIDALVASCTSGSASFECFHPLPPFVEDCQWNLQNCGSYVTARTMVNAIHTFATQADSCGIANQILGIEMKADADAREPASTEYVVRDSLNPSQKAAVKASILNSFTLLWGPPGTGKTYTIVEIIVQLQKTDTKRRILVTAPTHNAVDNVLRKYLAVSSKGNEQVLPLRVSTDVSYLLN